MIYLDSCNAAVFTPGGEKLIVCPGFTDISIGIVCGNSTPCVRISPSDARSLADMLCGYADRIERGVK